MKVDKTVARITAHLHRHLSPAVLAALKAAGVADLCLYSARSLVLEGQRGLWALLPGRDLAQDPVDTLFFLAPVAQGEVLAALVANAAGLQFPGRGSVLVEEVDLREAHALCLENSPDPAPLPPCAGHLHALGGICAIVQRGQGDAVARVLLDAGVCVPTIHFGTGTGIRDKMGLLRITIPAEKEIIHAYASNHEIDGLLEQMIETGRLDRPGSGFIYTFGVKKGLVNIRVRRGERRRAASIEQIVTAIDRLQGGTEWRHRRSIAQTRTPLKKRYIQHLADLVLLCDGGTGPELVQAAMAAGAGGATLAAVKHIRPPDSPLNAISPARDACSLVVPRDSVEAIIGALGAAGAFTDRCHGQVHVKPTFKAFTYTHG
jgi:nitrogen regulatory protein PII